jgi:hypothetical protein
MLKFFGTLRMTSARQPWSRKYLGLLVFTLILSVAALLDIIG